MITLFILLVVLEWLILSALVHTEHEIIGLWTVLGFLAAYWFLGGKENILSIWHFVTLHPGTAALYVGGYLLVGIVWSFFKWYLYVKKQKRQGATLAYLQRQNNKGRATGWIVYWPFSMVGYAIGDWLKDFFTWLYNRLSGVYDAILNKQFAE